VRAAHLSKSIFTAFPYADIYSDRTDGHRDEPGTVMVCGDGKEERYVANLLGQYYPGKSRYDNDSSEKRLKWFSDCLEALETLEGESFAFPCRIGCGAAGGDWKKYKELIDNFATRVDAEVFIIELK
jgi:O-acetyl-ADP-ribose deacetylase (regulator of RNase III)